MADLAPQFDALQGRLGALGAAPVPPPGPPGAPVLTVPPVIPALPVPAGGDTSSILSSPWLWVAIAVLLLAGLYFWYNSQKKKKE